jgi:hypothetical protein
MLGGAMGACSNCGVMVQPGDRFCNACGTPIGRASAPAPAAAPRYAPTPAGYSAQQPQVAPAAPAYAVPPAYAPPPATAAPVYTPRPPTGPPAFGPQASPAGPQVHPPSAAPRCQLGHEIVPGTSYCAVGHPIALDQMQFANDAYGAGFSSPTYAAGAAAGPHAAHPSSQASGPVAPTAAHPAAHGSEATGQPPAPFAPRHAPQAHERAHAPGPGAPPYRDAAPQVVPPKVLRGFLVAYGRNPNGDFWPLTGGRHMIGRLGSNDGIEIPIQDPTVSSRHATIIVDPATGSIVVEDAGSTNGTFVNDEPIGRAGWRELRDGDRLRVGGFTTVVKVIGPI